MNKKKMLLAAIGCLPAGALFAQAFSGTMAADSLRQQKELDAWMAPVVQRLDSTNKAWAAYESKHFDTVTRKFDTSGLGDVRAVTSALHRQERKRLEAYARLHPGELISLVALKRSLLPVPDDIHVTVRLFDALDSSVRSTPQGRQLEQRIAAYASVAVGESAPDFAMADTSSNPIRLSAYRGKYLLLDFWASWCGPCREENPIVMAAYKKFHGRNFEILSVSLDRPGRRADWVKAIRQDGLPWQQVSDLQFWNSVAARLYSIQSIPQNFLIDPSGKIIAVNLRGDELSKMLDKIL